jgi:hypothetical protein
LKKIQNVLYYYRKNYGLKKLKRFIVFKALILISAAVVFAQLEMPGTSGSPTSHSTSGLFGSDADAFIDPSAFTGVTFDKFYSMVSYGDIGSSRAEFGFATKIGGMYVAAAYGGSFWAGYTELSYTETTGNWNGEEKKFKIYDIDLDDPFDGSGTPENRIGILVGLADMGFRFTFSSVGHEWISFKDVYIGLGVQAKSYNVDRGYINPQLAWAMTKPLTEKGIQPYAVLDLEFHRDSVKYEDVNAPYSGINVIRSANYFVPALAVGLGGYTVYKSDGNFELSADFEYQIGFGIFSNDYSYVDGGSWKTKTINGTNDGANLQEVFINAHIIKPSFTGSWSGGPLGLKFQLSLPVEISGTTTRPIYDYDNDGKLVRYSKITTSSIGFNPVLALGMQWQILPDKLTMNAGGELRVSGGSIETTKYDGSGLKEVEDTKGSFTSGNLSVGFTFNPTANLSFDVCTGISLGNDFDYQDMLRFTRLLVSLKF